MPKVSALDAVADRYFKFFEAFDPVQEDSVEELGFALSAIILDHHYLRDISNLFHRN